jgi:hypothetical protein
MRSVVGAAVGAVLLAAPLWAQSPTEEWNGLPDRFQIDTGYFRIDSRAVLRFQGGSGTSGQVDFENDLGVDPNANTFWVDASWRLGRRHQIKLAYTKYDREGAGRTLTRDFVWGGQTFNAGLVANSVTGSDILGGYYRFALVRTPQFEIGPAIGVGHLWLSAGIRATGTVTGPGGEEEDRTLDRSGTTGSITGAVGGYATAWPAKRLQLVGDFLYIKANLGETEASVTDWRVGANVYPFRNAGLGVQYKFNKYTLDREILSSSLGGEIEFEGFQAFLSFKF